MSRWYLLVPVFIILTYATITYYDSEHSLIRLPIIRHGIIDIEDSDCNSEYLVDVKIGSQGKSFSVQLDTGSANLWVRSGNGSDFTFNCSASSTCVANTSDPITIKYGIGDLSGYTVQDSVTIGDLVIPRKTFILANSTSDLQSQGIIGVSKHRKPTTPQIPTILEALQAAGSIKHQVFSFYLGRTTTSMQTVGELIFGGYDPNYAKDEFHYVEVEPEAEHWQANLVSVGLGTNKSSTLNQPVIFDSGSTFLMLPEEFFPMLLSQAEERNIELLNVGGGCYKVNCSQRHMFDDVVFYFNETSVSLGPEYYFMPPTEKYSIDYCQLLALPVKGPATVKTPFAIGDPFLSKFYAVFDAERSVVGFAEPSNLVHTRYESTKVVA